MYEQKYKKITIIIDDGDEVTRYYFPKVRDSKFDVKYTEPSCEEYYGHFLTYGPSRMENISLSMHPERDEKTGYVGRATKRKSKRKKN